MYLPPTLVSDALEEQEGTQPPTPTPMTLAPSPPPPSAKLSLMNLDISGVEAPPSGSPRFLSTSTSFLLPSPNPLPSSHAHPLRTPLSSSGNTLLATMRAPSLSSLPTPLAAYPSSSWTWGAGEEGLSGVEESGSYSILNRGMIQSSDPSDLPHQTQPLPPSSPTPTPTSRSPLPLSPSPPSPPSLLLQDEEGVVEDGEEGERSDPMCNYETPTPTFTSALVTTLEEGAVVEEERDRVVEQDVGEYVTMYSRDEDEVRVDEEAAMLSDMEGEENGENEEDRRIEEGDSLLSSLSLLLPRKSLDMEPFLAPSSPVSKTNHHHVPVLLDHTPMKIKHHNFEELERMSGDKTDGRQQEEAEEGDGQSAKPLVFDVGAVSSGVESSGRDIMEEMRDRLLRKTNLTFDAMRLEVPSLNKRRAFDIDLSDNEEDEGEKDEDDEEEEQDGEVSHETNGSVDAYEI